MIVKREILESETCIDTIPINIKAMVQDLRKRLAPKRQAINIDGIEPQALRTKYFRAFEVPGMVQTLREGRTLPPIVVLKSEGGPFIMTDGHQRVRAHIELGRKFRHLSMTPLIWGDAHSQLISYVWSILLVFPMGLWIMF
jgi:hypothetical protein